jgi:hypothetical protein
LGKNGLGVGLLLQCCLLRRACSALLALLCKMEFKRRGWSQASVTALPTT